MASQLVPAEYEVIELKIENSKDTSEDGIFVSRFRRRLSLGFMIIYQSDSNSSQELSNSTLNNNNNNNNSNIESQEIDEKFSNIISNLSPDMEFNYNNIQGKQNYTNPKPRFTEASLVKRLEEKQIGRPSTYANMISVVFDRGYVNKKNIPPTNRKINIFEVKPEDTEVKTRTDVKKIAGEKNKMVPTERGEQVVNFLEKHFPTIMDYEFTAKMEEELDKIAAGDEKWNESVKMFYQQFHPEVDTMMKFLRNKIRQKEEDNQDMPRRQQIEEKLVKIQKQVIQYMF